MCAYARDALTGRGQVDYNQVMKKASEYRQHAEECRALAGTVRDPRQLEQLLEMAKTWDQLAADRSDLVRRHPELALEGEHREETVRPEKPRT
jgi:hypothetical protein